MHLRFCHRWSYFLTNNLAQGKQSQKQKSKSHIAFHLQPLLVLFSDQQPRVGLTFPKNIKAKATSLCFCRRCWSYFLTINLAQVQHTPTNTRAKATSLFICRRCWSYFLTNNLALVKPYQKQESESHIAFHLPPLLVLFSDQQQCAGQTFPKNIKVKVTSLFICHSFCDGRLRSVSFALIFSRGDIPMPIGRTCPRPTVGAKPAAPPRQFRAKKAQHCCRAFFQSGWLDRFRTSLLGI
jgi:hypothetical protein